MSSQPEPFDQFAIAIARESWDVFRRDPALFVIAGMVYLAVTVCTLGLLAGPLLVGFIELIRRQRAGEPVAVSTLFSRFDTLIPSSVALFAFLLLAGIGALLILPGLLAIVFFMFCVPAIAYEGVGGIESLRVSYALVRANFMPTVALILLLSLAHFLGGLIMFGFVVTLPLGNIATTLAYERLRANSAPPG